MKQSLLGIGLMGVAWAVCAQWPSVQERQAESARLDARRLALEDRYTQDMRLCYQEFDVTSCRLKARDRRIEDNVQLRKDELAFKNLERQIKAEEIKQRMLDKQAQAQQQEVERQHAAQEAQERVQEQAAKVSAHEAKGEQRQAYEKKQREAQSHRDNLERKLRMRDKPPAAPLPEPGVSR
jgi:colicin import membrane protein